MVAINYSQQKLKSYQLRHTFKRLFSFSVILYVYAFKTQEPKPYPLLFPGLICGLG